MRKENIASKNMFNKTISELNKINSLFKQQNHTKEEFDYVRLFPAKLATLLIEEFGDKQALAVAKIIENLVG